VPGGGVDLASGVGLGGFSLPTPADSATVSIYNSSGALVDAIDLGAQSAGITKWQWNGTNSAGATVPDGSYTFKVNASMAGNAVAANNLQYGLINSVTQGATGLTLSVGALQNIALTQVQQIL
jgi:flagellar basal-body rod modification protein FlgD